MVSLLMLSIKFTIVAAFVVSVDGRVGVVGTVGVAIEEATDLIMLYI